MQGSFLESLIGNDNTNQVIDEIKFPKNFKINNFNKLREDFNALAESYGLLLPTKLKKGQLVLEIKNPSDKEKINLDKSQKTSLTFEEIKAIEESFD